MAVYLLLGLLCAILVRFVGLVCFLLVFESMMGDGGGGGGEEGRGG